MRKILLIILIIFFNSRILADDKMILGLEVFNNKAQCGTCHTLKASESYGDIGPNLDQIKSQKDQIIYTVTNGIGVMPSFLDILTADEIEAVAHYVFNSSNN